MDQNLHILNVLLKRREERSSEGGEGQQTSPAGLIRGTLKFMVSIFNLYNISCRAAVKLFHWNFPSAKDIYSMKTGEITFHGPSRASWIMPAKRNTVIVLLQSNLNCDKPNSIYSLCIRGELEFSWDGYLQTWADKKNGCMSYISLIPNLFYCNSLVEKR